MVRFVSPSDCDQTRVEIEEVGMLCGGRPVTAHILSDRDAEDYIAKVFDVIHYSLIRTTPTPTFVMIGSA
jgi:hypothetical protein